ncbi:MAG: WbuC family cupin fold metalloprotein [Desulfomonilia bacterium]
MKLITSDLIDELIVRAGTNTRQRINYNIHESLSDPVQRLFIASSLESYFRPHLHPEKWEFALVIRGLFDVMVFNDAGKVIERVSIGPSADVIGFEIPENTWHSWVPMADRSVFFETKQGPYDARSSEFAAWSPEEDTQDVNEFLSRLKNAKVGEMVRS